MSKLFNCILKKVCAGQVAEPFRVKDVLDCLNTSTPFLSKHCVDKFDKSKVATGNPYFIRIARGQYIINPDFKTCP
jgi:hypothetical protein